MHKHASLCLWILVAFLPVTVFFVERVAAIDAATMDEASTLALLVKTIEAADDDSVRVSLMKGMLRGLEGRRNVEAPPSWARLAEEYAVSENESLRDAADRLSQIFGDRAASERAMVTLLDPEAPLTQRQAALASLVAQRYAGLEDELPGLLDSPDLRLDVIRAFGAIAQPDAPAILLSRYPTESGEVQRAIIETLATRKTYASHLVDGIKTDLVRKEQVPSYVARSLQELLGKQFTDAYGSIPKLQKKTRETIAKYKQLITDQVIDQADSRRGRIVFEKTCGACHLMYGVGGKVGPDLTGSNRGNLDYFLLNSIDPNGDVPEGYRTQLIQTIDGRVLTGVLAEEDNQRVILKTVDLPRVVIAKEDIETRKVSNQSMMPEGQLDQLSREDLFDLVKYMQTKSQVELEK
jgi:putative heme-binding domain-containing protein